MLNMAGIFTHPHPSVFFSFELPAVPSEYLVNWTPVDIPSVHQIILQVA